MRATIVSVLLLAAPVAAFTVPGAAYRPVAKHAATLAPACPPAAGRSPNVCMNEANVVLEVVDAVVNAIPLVIPGAAVAFIGLDLLLPNGVRSLVDGEEGTGFAAIDPTAPQTPEEIIYKITFAALTVGSLIFSYIVYS